MKGADLDLEELVKQYVYQWGNERMFPTMDVCETALRTLHRLGKRFICSIDFQIMASNEVVTVYPDGRIVQNQLLSRYSLDPLRKEYEADGRRKESG